MVNAKKQNAKKAKNQKEETKEEFQERISEQMQVGFEWSTEQWTIKKIINAYGEGILIDPDYQRGNVWDTPKNKALIETIMRYGGNKIPTLTFRKLDDGTFEIMDGKQRILSSIVPFVENKFRLNGVYNPELTGYNLEDIKNEYPMIYSAFMSTSIPAQIATNMSYDEAVTYFIQINNSGVNMNIGEQIHAMQGTPLIKTIDELVLHPVWNNVQRISRFNNYSYTGKMLLFSIDKTDNGSNIIVYTNKQLLNALERYYGIPLPKSAVSDVKRTFDVLHKIFHENSMCVTITEFLTLFIYVNTNLDKMNAVQFGKFISGLYKNIKDGKGGIFEVIKLQHRQLGYDYTAKYYQWYINNINRLYAKWLEGAKWDELQRLSVKE